MLLPELAQDRGIDEPEDPLEMQALEAAVRQHRRAETQNRLNVLRCGVLGQVNKRSMAIGSGLRVGFGGRVGRHVRKATRPGRATQVVGGGEIPGI